MRLGSDEELSTYVQQIGWQLEHDLSGTDNQRDTILEAFKKIYAVGFENGKYFARQEVISLFRGKPFSAKQYKKILMNEVKDDCIS